MCLVFSVETGEKAEKESQTIETEQPEVPKKSATKKEKKPKREGGFQIWTELETQRNKFMVTQFLVFISLMFFSCIILISLSTYKLTNHLKNIHLSFVELPLQKLLQSALFGSVPRICPELHSAVLQGEEITLDLNNYVVDYMNHTLKMTYLTQ